MRPEHPATICGVCAQAGPTRPTESLRWTVRDAEGREVGPLDRHGVHLQIARGAVGADAPIRRVGGPWLPLIEHPDHRAAFIPGTPLWQALQKERESATGTQRDLVSGQRRRLLFAALAMGGSLALAAWAIGTGGLVLPEEILERLGGSMGESAEQLGAQVEVAMDPEAAARQAAAAHALAGADEIRALQAAWPEVDLPPALLLARGRTALWRADRASEEEARQVLEQGVAASPEDPELIGSLVEAWGRASAVEGRMGQISALIERLNALAPASVALARARAALAWSQGDRETTRTRATECLAGTSGTEGDPTCRVLLARLSGDLATLTELTEAFHSPPWILLLRAELALEQGRMPEAQALARSARSGEGEVPRAWAIEALAAEAQGDGAAAWPAARHAAELAPEDLDLRLLAARLRYQVDGDADGALSELSSLLEAPGVGSWSGEEAAVREAASIASSSGDDVAALSWSDRILAAHPGDPIAALSKARALVGLGKGELAEAAIASAEEEQLQGADLIRWSLSAARFHRDLGRDRGCAAMLDKGLKVAPAHPGLLLERAALKSRMGDLGGAVRDIEELARTDHGYWAAADGASRIQVSGDGVTGFQRKISDALQGDLRGPGRAAAAAALIAWGSGGEGVEEPLQRALSLTDDPIPVQLALAQVAFEQEAWARALLQLDAAKAGGSLPVELVALRALVLAHLDRPAEAMEASQRFGRDQTLTAAAHFRLAEALDLAGDHAGAREHLDAAARLTPDHRALGALRLALEEPDR